MVGDAAIAQILLTAGADVDTSLRPNMMPTPLILAAELGLADVVRVLLRANASLLPTLRGMTALEAALDPAVRRLLLQATGAKSDPRVRAQQQRKSRGKGGAALASDDAYDFDEADYAEGGGGLPSAMTVAVVLALLCTAIGLARHCVQGTASPQRERKAGRRGKATSDSEGSEARGKATRTEAKAVATPTAEAKRAADAKRVAEAKRAAEKAVAKEEQKLRRRRGPEAAGEGGEARGGAPACGAEDFTRQREDPVRREAEAVQEALLESIAASRAAAFPSGPDAAAGLRAVEAAAEAKAVAAAAAKPVAVAAKPAAAAAAAAKPVAAAPKPVAAAAKPVAAAAAKPVAAKSEAKVKAAKEGDESVKAKAPHAKAEGAAAAADANVGAAAAEVAGGAAPHVVERQRVQMERLARAARGGGTAAAAAAPAVEETFEVVDKNEARRKRKEEAEGRQTQERQAEAEVRRKAEEERERRRREQLEVEVAQRKAAVAAAAVAAASKAAARPGAPPPKSQQQQPPSVRNGGANANSNANGHAHGSGARNGGPAERGQAFSVVAGGRPDAAAPSAAPSHEEVELQLALALSRSLADDDAEPSGIEQSSMQQQEAQQEQLLHALLNSSHEPPPPHHASPHAPQPAAWGPPNATGAFGQAPAPMPLSMPPPQQPMQPPQLPQGWQAQLPQQALLRQSSLEKFAQLPSLLPTQPASPHAAGLARYAHAPALHAGSWGAPQPGAEATWGAPTGPAADGAQPAGGAQWGAPPVGCVGGGWPSQGAGALPAGLPAGLPARLPQSAGLPPPGDLLAVRQAQALIAAMPRGLPPPRAHPPGVLSHVRSSSPVGGEPVGSDRSPAGAPLEGIAGGKGVADDAPLVGDKARTA